MKIRRVFQRALYSPASQIYALIILVVLIRLIWIGYTDYIDEDAFITFRFARQIASGKGFVYNPGEPLYGTTTPLFTLLLSVWLFVFQNDAAVIARVFGITALLGSLIFVALSLEKLRVNHPQRIFIMALFVLASKFWWMETSGMETPLVICLMSASWYSAVERKPVWTGVLCGLLLWTRIDLVLWVMILILFAAWQDPRRGVRIILITVLTYLPWVLFATAYFGSPIPHTITAKWNAYFEYGRQFEQVFAEPLISMWLARLAPIIVVIQRLLPFDISQQFDPISSLLLLFLSLL